MVLFGSKSVGKDMLIVVYVGNDNFVFDWIFFYFVWKLIINLSLNSKN